MRPILAPHLSSQAKLLSDHPQVLYQNLRADCTQPRSSPLVNLESVILRAILINTYTPKLRRRRKNVGQSCRLAFSVLTCILYHTGYVRT